MVRRDARSSPPILGVRVVHDCDDGPFQPYFLLLPFPSPYQGRLAAEFQYDPSEDGLGAEFVLTNFSDVRFVSPRPLFIPPGFPWKGVTDELSTSPFAVERMRM